MRPSLMLLITGLTTLSTVARAESVFAPSDLDEAHPAALSTYADGEVDDLSALLVQPEVQLGTIRTTSAVNVSEQVGQQLERDISRTLRQRHAHAQFCADQSSLPADSAEVVVHLRVDDQGARTVSSDAHPSFARCLTHLAQHWPIPAVAYDSRTRVAYRAVAPTTAL